jgi:soluble lytic murein transglycosylase
MGAAAPLKVRAGDDPELEVAPLVRLHRNEEAVKRLDARSTTAPSMRYLRARLLARLGRLDEAIAGISAADMEASLPVSIQRDARYRKARWQARAGRCEAAEPVLAERAGAGGRAGALAGALLAECQVMTGRYERAARLLRQVAEQNAPRVDSFAARLELAEVLYRLGRGSDAKAALRQLLLDRPEHREASRAAGTFASRFGALHWTVRDRLHRAARLVRTRHYEAALSELAGPEPRSPSLRARWLHLRGLALFRSRNHYEEAARVLRRAARLPSPTAVADAFRSARALSRAGHDAQAVRAYRRLVRRYPRHRRAQQAEYLAAWLELNDGRAVGERHMRRFLRGPRGRGRRAVSALWHLGLAAYERGAFREAAGYFRRYERRGSGGMTAGRGAYWQGRALERGGLRAAAARAYRRAIRIEPLHWYALWARKRLEGLEVAVPPPLPSTGSGEPKYQRPAASAKAALPDDVAFYHALGLRHDAQRRYRRHEPRVIRRGGLAALVAGYHAIGEYTRPYRLASVRHPHALGRWPGEAPWVWQAVYPEPWRGTVRAAATAGGLPPALLFAVMRQESAYDPDVVSYAGAAGLLQLMPATARRIARDQSLPADHLLVPATNIRLGALYLAELLRSVEDNAPLAVAAYNAGAHRVRRWLRERGPMPLDHFVERIPFNQTRGYVRHVMTHYARYRFLAEGGRDWPEVPLPDTVAP